MKIQKRYAVSNGPQIFQIQQEMQTQVKGNLSLLEYFNRMQALWDEYDCLTSGKTLEELKDLDRLIQYLVGLGDGYEHARHQILLIDPLPNVEKAYSMLLNVESEMVIQVATSSGMDCSAFLVKQQFVDKSVPVKMKTGINKTKLLCEHCKRKGHNKSMCFKLHGYPDWYRDLQKRRQALDRGKGFLGPRTDGMAASILETIKAKLFKYFGNKDHKGIG